jgi:hypothetical protein
MCGLTGPLSFGCPVAFRRLTFASRGRPDFFVNGSSLPPFFAGGATIRDLLRRHGRRRQLSFFDAEPPTEDPFDREQLERVRIVVEPTLVAYNLGPRGGKC